MKRLVAFVTILLAHAAWFANTSNAADGNVDLPRYPSVSPDGSQIVFSWRGDLWKVSAHGGGATRLTSHPQDDLQSAWSRDGKRIAFTSDRTGALNIFMMDADGTGIRQLVETDRPMGLVGFGTDEQGKEVVTFSARLEPEFFPSPRPFMISTEGKGAEPARVHDAFGTFPAVSPDGTKVLFNRGGGAWSRRNYRGSDTRDVWLYERKTKSFTRLTNWQGNDGRARWIDDKTFVYASDRKDDTVNLYKLSLGQPEDAAIRLTSFTGADVEDFDISADGKTLVFAMWDKLYTLDLAHEAAKPMAIVIRGNEDEADRYVQKDVSRSVSEAQLSPDGKTMAFVAYGQVYVRNVEKNSPTRRLTNDEARERDVAWSADGGKLYFASDRSGVDSLYEATVTLTRSEARKQYEEANKASPATQPTRTTAPSQAATSQPATHPSTQPSDAAARWPDAVTFEVKRITDDDAGDTKPSPSPDGRLLAFRRGLGNLMILEPESGKIRKLVSGWSDSLDWRWSPDSKRIAYVTEDENANADIWIVGADGAASAVNITRHPDNDYSPRWSADGKMLAFLSERVNEEFDVWMVWLDKDMEGMSAADLDEYYKEAGAAAKKRKPIVPTTKPTTNPTSAPATAPTTAPAATQSIHEASAKPLDLDDAYLRVKRITTLAGNESELEISPAGDKYYFVATIGSTSALWSLDRDSSDPKKIGPAGNVQGISLAGDQLSFVEAGRGGYLKLPEGTAEYVDISDKMRIDLQAQSSQKFLEAARIVGFNYYDPKMNGLDWAAVTKRYHELAKAARTNDEFEHVAWKLIGELNGSHLGIMTPDPVIPGARKVGYFGITGHREGDGYKVESILRDSPAQRAATKLKIGDVIAAIDSEPFEDVSHPTLESLLAGKVDREVVVSVRRDGTELVALITPISYERLAELTYKDWRFDTAKKVEDWSGGKLGYIHIQSMSQESLDVFERDLYAAAYGKRGLIIDVRNNGGGWTTDRLLASIMYPRHAYTVPRGLDAKQYPDGYPQDRLFIQRYSGPIDMLCNEKSFSNAEIISHAFKTLRRGTLVGQETAGGVISTGAAQLIDGTTVRTPFRGWYLPDGTNMERHGAVPDVIVTQTPQDETTDSDSQLKAAVEDLLKRTGK